MSIPSAKSRRRALEREQGLRRPLVLAARREAVEQAARLGVAGCLENLVAAAIVDGRVVGFPRVGGTARVTLLDGGYVVEVKRVEAPSGRKAWIPIGIERTIERRR